MLLYEISPVLPAEHEYAIGISGWHRDDRQPQDDPEPVTRIKIQVVEFFDEEFLAQVDQLGPREGGYNIWYRLGRLTPSHAETLTARLAASGLLDDMFGQVERTHRQGPLASVATGQAVAAWLAAEIGQLDEALPEGWARYLVAAPATASIYTRVVSGGLAAATHLTTNTTSIQGLAVWPDGHPDQVVVTDPAQFTRELEFLQSRGITFLPVPRRELAAAVWRAGGTNVNALSRALGVDRKTVYAELRAAGLEPTDRA